MLSASQPQKRLVEDELSIKECCQPAAPETPPLWTATAWNPRHAHVACDRRIGSLWAELNLAKALQRLRIITDYPPARDLIFPARLSSYAIAISKYCGATIAVGILTPFMKNVGVELMLRSRPSATSPLISSSTRGY